MPGFIVHLGASVICSHGGQAQPTAPNPRVMVSGQPVVTIAAPYVVAGCPFFSGVNPLPCVTGQWLVGATRVFAGGQPVVVQSSSSVCTPNGTPLIILVTQPRVNAT
ncbi:MAG: hypothetical protein M9928_17965 [Anaerolineae bacterium]|nr:hypothetical protein [Anaerolineae bacterium]MCO5194773.1 hypothetical protein [Anaerolineae bacterium]MCO5206902.1 hypothetical protein [Anaerolineae bacterium]